MKDLAVVGAGGFGRETVHLVNRINEADRMWNIVGFYADDHGRGEYLSGLPVLGSIVDLANTASDLAVSVAVGEPAGRMRLALMLSKSPHLSFPNLIHPCVFVGSSVTMGMGNTICEGVRITVDITTGDFNIINLNCTVGHDTHIDSYCTLAPNVSLSGYVSLGRLANIGTGAVLLPHVHVSERAVVGAGAVVVREVPPGTTVVGIPARPIERHGKAK